MTDFEIFYDAYPRKVARKDAEKAFKAAIKITDLKTILDGLDRYKRNKPDWQQWKYPGPWLRAEKWADEYGEQGSSEELLTSEELVDFRKKLNEALMRRDRMPPVPKRSEAEKARAAQLLEDFKRGKKVGQLQG